LARQQSASGELVLKLYTLALARQQSSNGERGSELPTERSLLAGKWLRPRSAWGLVLVPGSVVAVFFFILYLVVGPPTTPMTVQRADRIFGEGLKQGMSRENVESWLVSRSIPPAPQPPERVCYDINYRREDGIFKGPIKGWWMGCRGHQTMAELAGLDVDEVFSMIRVHYPNAGLIIGGTRITVYLFFDEKGRHLRHWTDEFEPSL